MNRKDEEGEEGEEETTTTVINKKSNNTITEYDIYHEGLLTRKITLSIDECAPSFIQNHILRKIKDEIEGKCINEGWIKPKSIRDVIYSSGNCHYGGIDYVVQFKCDICLPIRNATYSAKFISINTAGIYAEYIDPEGNRPLCFFVNRDYKMNFENETFLQYENPEFAEKNSFLQIKVLFFNYELNDKYIATIAQIL